jgi:hypothetical protein
MPKTEVEIESYLNRTLDCPSGLPGIVISIPARVRLDLRFAYAEKAAIARSQPAV